MKFLTMLMSLFGWMKVTDIPTEEGSVALSSEQEKELKEMLSDAQYNKFMDAVNKELELQENKKESEKLKTEILQALEDEDTPPDISRKIKQKVKDGKEIEGVDVSGVVKDLLADMKNIKEKNKELQSNISKLSGEDEEEEVTKALNIRQSPVKHSATHLFGTNFSYDAFDDTRPWNSMLKDATIGNISAAQATLDSFKEAKEIDPMVKSLNNDLSEYYAQNPQTIKDLQYDTFGLPSNWKKKTGVVDIIRDAGIRVGNNITQARKAGWKTKGGSTIEVEEGMVYPIQIDTQWLGIKLMELAETYLQEILMSPASGPHGQMRFVLFVTQQYNKRREEEDNECSVTGVYVKHPNENITLEGTINTAPGDYKNRQHGILILSWIHRNIHKKIKPIKVGMNPTNQNIDEYLTNYIEGLPLKVQKSSGLSTYVSWDLFLAYVKKVGMFNPAKDEYQKIVNMSMEDFKNYDYSNLVANIVGYKNQKLVPLPQLGDTKFIFTTWDDNIEILENNPMEKVSWTFQQLKRDIYAWLDYKMGIRFIYVGSSSIPLDNKEKLLSQHVWTNDQEVFEENFSVPVYDLNDGKMTVAYKRVFVDENWKTDVTEIDLRTSKYHVEKIPAGEILHIQGNPNLTAAKYVKNNTNLSLKSQWNMKTEGTLTLLSLGNGMFKELQRTTTAPLVDDNVITFSTDAIDASQSDSFDFVGTEATTLSDIIGGVEGQQITITGNSTADLTVSDSDTFVVGESVTVNNTTSLVLVKAGGKWFKVEQ